MITFKPRSILQLVVIGFLAVAGILIVTLVINVRQLDGLGDQSRRIINQSAAAMQASQTLVAQVSSMERNARQYTIVGDPEILDVYGDRRRSFSNAAEQLSRLNLDAEMTAILEEVVADEALAHNALTSGNAENKIDSIYPRLMEGTGRVFSLVNDWTNNQLEAIRRDTEETKTLLTIQSVALVSIALVLAGVFTVLITSPLLQIEKAINQLGNGLYKPSIRISGPRDLVSLGQRLDWLRSRLGKLEQQRSSFLRHVSHELKTPLAAMQESASLLRDGAVGELSAEQEEIIRIQNKNCQRLQTLIDDLLRYNSESFSVLNAMPQPVRLDEVVENVLEAHELTFRSRGLTVARRLGKIKVLGDAEQLRVIVDNLVTNAIKYSPEGGRIDTTLERRDDKVLFDIIDDGPGIDAAEAGKIFDAFYQGRSPGSDFHNGSGLGLAIVQEYIQANGGTIEVIDCSRGAHFRVSLPAYDDKPGSSR